MDHFQYHTSQREINENINLYEGMGEIIFQNKIYRGHVQLKCTFIPKSRIVFSFNGLKAEGIVEFFNSMEKNHPGIKYNAYNTMLKVSKVVRDSMTSDTAKKCAICGRDSTGNICSVCNLVRILEPNKQI